MVGEHAEVAAVLHDHGCHAVPVSFLDGHLHRHRRDVESESGVAVQRGGGVAFPDDADVGPGVYVARGVLLYVVGKHVGDAVALAAAQVREHQDIC